jgi:putative transposase
MTEDQVAVLPFNELAPEAIDAARRVLNGPDEFMPASFSSIVAQSTTLAITYDDPVLSKRVARAATDAKAARRSAIVHEAMNVPSYWAKGRRAWIEMVALKNEVSWQAVYKWIAAWEKNGAAGLLHANACKSDPSQWDAEAIDLWMGICLKRSHRKISKLKLYELLAEEALARGLKIGSYRSACWWYTKKITPQLLAMQRGGRRALDNVLPPVLRDYSDLAPFEMLVGDQHRFDFWVMDDDTGEVFRPEGYFWQDLRTRIIYGGAVTRRYDGYLIGLALRIGMRIFGAFGSIYTDNGKPELSSYIMGVMSQMRAHRLYVNPIVDAAAAIDADEDLINPCMILPGTHKKAVVKNAKAKMIEGNFSNFEIIMRDKLLIPGNVKRMSDGPHEQDIDQDEAKRMAENGQLLTFREFMCRMYQAIDYYNKDKHHRGVRKEWLWNPKPRVTTPMMALKKCVEGGWAPRRMSPDAIDMLFLAHAPRGRVVDKGRVSLFGTMYEHNDLVPLHGRRVEVRYDPMDPDSVLIVNDGDAVCQARPVEYSSMKDADLASRKIEAKRRLLKACTEEYRRMTSDIPDFIRHSDVPQIEKDAAKMAGERKRISMAESELYRERTDAELAEEVAAIEQASEPRMTPARELPIRPVCFMDKWERYEWCVYFEIAGGVLEAKDADWKAAHEASMTPEQLDYWNTVKQVECGGTY